MRGFLTTEWFVSSRQMPPFVKRLATRRLILLKFIIVIVLDHHNSQMFLIPNFTDKRGICHENLWADIDFKGGGDVEV